MKASELFVNALERGGVKYIFGIPGEENLDLLASQRESSIRRIVTRHDRVRHDASEESDWLLRPKN
jgi:acetolactate synthase-1/2/3 large subunit